MSRRRSHRQSNPAETTVQARGFDPRRWFLVGLVAIYAARLLFPSESVAMFGDGLALVMLWIVLGLGWILMAVWRGRWEWRAGATELAVLVLLVLHTVSALWAVGHGAPRPAVNMLWEWIGLGVGFLLARQLIRTAGEARAVAAAMIALAVALAGLGLYQYAVELPATRAHYRENPEAALKEAGLWYAPGSPERQLFEQRLASTEPIATFALTNSLAGYLAPWLVVTVGVGLVLWGRRRGQEPRPPEIASPSQNARPSSRPLTPDPRPLSPLLALAVFALVMAACLLLTKSRSGYLAAGLGVGLVWLASRAGLRRIGWKTPLAVAAVLGLLVAGGIFVGGLDREVLTEASKSLGYRTQYWRATLQMIGDHPWLGCGPGNFRDEYTRYKLPDASEEIADPHNFLLEIGATAGIPAALAFVAVLASFAWGVVQSARQEPRPPKTGSAGASPSQDAAPFQSPARQEPRPPKTPRTLPDPRPLTPDPLTSDPRPLSPDPFPFALPAVILGFVLAYPLGLVSSAPPSVATWLIGLPLAVVAVAALGPWVRHGSLPVWVPGIGVVVLLVDLSAAGGIGFPSVAGSLWLLVAMGLSLAEVDRPPRLAGRAAAVGVAALLATLAVTCYTSAYRPVFRSRAMLDRAEAEPAHAEELLAASAVADPLSEEPWQQLAAIAFARWRQEPSPDSLRRFEECDQQIQRLRPHWSAGWQQSGDRYLAAYAQTRLAAEGRKAVESYRRAAELYPNSATTRAKLALALAATGDRTGAARERERALWLDTTTPHLDQKLPDELRKDLQRKVSRSP
jgi:O-antigen ligase